MKAPWVGTLLTVVLAVAGVALPQGQAPTFKSGVDLASFNVTVVDKRGNFVKDLKESEFEVLEDGQKQTLKYFMPGGDAGLPPLHLGALLDISGSMEEEMSLARSASIKFLKTLDDAEDMTLVDFDTEVRVARYTHADFPSLVERVRSRKADPNGYTALYDAVAVYLDTAAAQDGRKILVLYTDGGDNRSQISFPDLVTLLRGSDATVYSIGFMQHAGTAAVDLRGRLRALADTTGGQWFFPASMDDLKGVYEKIHDEIRAQYAMGFISTNTKQDGSWRKVEIKVTRNGGRDLKIRTRKGYFAPYRRPSQ